MTTAPASSTRSGTDSPQPTDDKKNSAKISVWVVADSPQPTDDKKNSAATAACARCGAAAASACIRCEEPYCSKECQTADWPEHKKACRRRVREAAAKHRLQQAIGKPQVSRILSDPAFHVIDVSGKSVKAVLADIKRLPE